ncbi:thiol:disulfide interchange protein DsbC [Gammaproteobacteria bacterium]
MYKHVAALLLPLALFASIPVAIADQDQDIAQIRETIKTLSTTPLENTVTPSPIPGIYEVVMGPSIAYFSADGRYMLIGDLVDTKGYKNLTAPRRNESRISAINALSEDEMFIFAPEKEAKHTITVFTDIDCGYCRKLHRDIKSYNDNGIKVRYLLFPRAGKDSVSYEKAVSAWCAKDRNAALTRAKNGEELERKDCPNPVKRHMALGELLGVTGTPTIITDTGEILPGYVPAAPLAKLLNGEVWEEKAKDRVKIK